METLNILFEITVYSGVIFTATMLLKTCFKSKMSPLLHYAVWFVLVLRLMLPATIASPVRLFVIPVEPQIPIGMVVQPDAYQPVTTSGINTEDIADTQPQAEAVSPVHNETPVTHENAGQLLSLSLPQVLTLAWLAGAGVCLSYLAFLYASLRRKIRRNAARPSKRLIELFEEAKSEMGIKANIKLVCQYEYGTPSLMFPGTVMMPMDALVAMNDEQTMFALRHELTHYRRGDHIVSILLSLLNAVYWFDPFVWAAFRQIRKDMEAACDGSVVKTLCGAAKSRYALLIVSLSAQPAHRQLVLGMSRLGLRKAAERRVKSIFMKGKSNMSVKIITVLLAAVLLFTCFTTACQPVAVDKITAPNDASEQPAVTTPDNLTTAGTYKDEIVQPGTGNTVIIDAQVTSPDIDSIDIMSYKPKNFTMDEINNLIKYFVGDAQLYDGEYQDTKADLESRIAETQQIIAMTQEERDAVMGGMTYEEAQRQLKDLQARYEKATDDFPKIPITTSLKSDKDGEYLEAYVDNGGSDDAIISVFNPGDGNFIIRLRDAAAGGRLLNYSGSPEEVAQKVLDGLNISGAHLYRNSQAAASNDPGNRKKVTRLFYDLTLNGLPIGGGPVTGNVIEYERSVSHQGPVSIGVGEPETIGIDVGENGLTCVSWSRHSEIGEPVKKNVALLPFEDIMRQFEENIFLQPFWTYSQGSEPSEYCITDIKLCLASVPRMDGSGGNMLLPVWNFYGSPSDPLQDSGNSNQKIAGMFVMRLVQKSNCVLTLSAVDGALLKN